MITRPTRARFAGISLLLDVVVMFSAFALLPLRWEFPDQITLVASVIGAGALLGMFLAGAYRVDFPIRPALARLTPLGFFFGGFLGWLILKLLSQKGDLWTLIPPALEGFTVVMLALALVSFAHRAVHLGLIARRENQSPVALVAEPAAAAELAARWRARGWDAPLLALVPSELAVASPPIPTLADLHALVLAVPLQALHRLELERLAEARATGLPVMSAARFEEELFGYTPLATPDDPWLLFDEALVRRTALYLGAKRLIDLLLAVVTGALLLAPFVLLVLLLRLTSRGPVFYLQTRAGLNRRPFTLWKLRTMVPDAERASGPTFAGHDDPRVTRLGRFLRRSRIDELPQLWNIVRGDMSFVGPRPERPEFDHELAPAIPFYALRHLARPGLTGWAQVRLGYAGSPADAFRKLEHDVYYLKHASLGFDLAILVRTIPVVLRLRGR